MSHSQTGFLFDAPLETIPVSQLPALAPKCEPDVLLDRLRAILPELPDDIDLDAPLLAIGEDILSLTAWHRSRALDALIGLPSPEFQAYRVEGKVRFRRLPPLSLCPGYDDIVCNALTRGGVRCQRCLAIENEDLFNQL